MFLFLIVILSVSIWIWYRSTFGRAIELSEKIPGPRMLPIIGNALIFLNEKPEYIMDSLLRLAKKYGGLFRVWIGPFQLSIVSTNPKDVETVLSSTKHIRKSYLYALLVPWLGDGLLLSTGAKWHGRRKIITPTFHFKILEEFLPVFSKNTQVMRELLKQEVPEYDSRIIDIYPFISRCTLDIICETAMGIELNSQTDADLPYVKAVLRISEILSIRGISVWMRNDFLFKWFGGAAYKEHQECLKILHDFTDNIIQLRRATINENHAQGDPSGIDQRIGIKKKQALLDMLLKASSTVDGKALSNEEIREEVDTFMFEGHDTTAAAIGFTLYLISKYPEVQQKIYDEIQAVLGDKQDNLTYSDLSGLQYLELVIKESLRLYPPVPFMGRRIEEEFELNGRLIPANSNLSIGVYQMGRDENIYKNPLEFIPERFESSEMAALNPFAYVPFSAGPRNCIGQKFAMMELKSVFVMILGTFELYDAQFKPIVVAQVVLRSTNGFELGMRRRDGGRSKVE